ncbi:hypothetical protein BGW80DRAFT_1255014 [Lactifluus volemus]|nr:hypothetical protein BGW80DRAFT_1255014 [Lactifluus volemus]
MSPITPQYSSSKWTSPRSSAYASRITTASSAQYFTFLSEGKMWGGILDAGVKSLTAIAVLGIFCGLYPFADLIPLLLLYGPSFLLLVDYVVRRWEESRQEQAPPQKSSARLIHSGRHHEIVE